MQIHAQREAMRQRAREAMLAGDYRAAHSLLRYLIRQDSADAEAKAMLARLHSRQAVSSNAVAGRSREQRPRSMEPDFRFRSIALIGTAMLLLVIAFLLPNGTVVSEVGALKLHSAPSSQIRPASHAVASVPIASHDRLSAIPSAKDATGQDVTPTNGAPAEPPVPGQGGTCISGFSIDRYDQPVGAGWTVTITPEGGDPQPTVADAEGHFKFENVATGTYTVSLEIPDGWRPFTDTSLPVTLSGSGAHCAEVRFKVEALPCLLVNKVDAGSHLRVGIPGWQMTAVHDDISLRAVTDGTGQAYFYDLIPGTWTVTEESVVGWQPAVGHGYQKSINLISPRKPGVCATLTFGNEQIHDGCIQIQKVDPVGVPIKGWKMTVIRDDGTRPSVSNYTDSSGFVIFKGLALGQWTVQERAKAWWRPVGEAEQAVELTVPGHCEVVIFANEPLGCVDGYKVNHLDQGLVGWEITAQNNATGESLSMVTDGTGYFRFQDITLGTWSVSEEMPTGWEPVTPAKFSVKVQEPFSCEQVRFKNRAQYACMDVFKVDDADGSGLAGWEFTLQPAYGGEAVTGQTDSTGRVRFNALTPGTYIVSETSKRGWTAVTPTPKTVKVKATGACKVITFRNRQ